MKFVVKKEILLDSLNNTSKAISTKNLIPILTGIKFDLKEDGLYLYASDTDVSIRTYIPKDKLTSLDEIGSIVIGGKYIVEIVRKLPSTDISIEVIDGYKLIISTDNTEFNLNGVNPNEYPNLDLDETKEPIVINTEVFKEMINQTVFATSPSETRPLLTGINFRMPLISNIFLTLCVKLLISSFAPIILANLYLPIIKPIPALSMNVTLSKSNITLLGIYLSIS